MRLSHRAKLASKHNRSAFNCPWYQDSTVKCGWEISITYPLHIPRIFNSVVLPSKDLHKICNATTGDKTIRDRISGFITSIITWVCEVFNA